MPREWDTPLREPWNPVIHRLLKAIDHHNQLYFDEKDPWHLEKAEELRKYVEELKSWIIKIETIQSGD
jgi:hypothetical protein